MSLKLLREMKLLQLSDDCYLNVEGKYNRRSDAGIYIYLISGLLDH